MGFVGDHALAPPAAPHPECPCPRRCTAAPRHKRRKLLAASPIRYYLRLTHRGDDDASCAMVDIMMSQGGFDVRGSLQLQLGHAHAHWPVFSQMRAAAAGIRGDGSCSAAQRLHAHARALPSTAATLSARLSLRVIIKLCSDLLSIESY